MKEFSDMTAIPSEKLAIDGGTPVRDANTRSWVQWPIYDETEEKALLDVLRSGQWWYVGGEQGAAAEQEFAASQDAKYAVACANGTVALEIVLRALGVGCGDEVIVPPYTFVATASAVLAVGATPVFVDIQGDTWNIDPLLIEPAITSRTKAIIPVHIAGRPADMDAILDIAKRHSLYVIEDAAQAHGAAWRGTRVGALGHLGTFSFQASKNVNAGEGGMIVSNDEELADAAWSVTNVGRVRSGRWYEHRVLGGNYRLTEFQSAILRTQLARLPEQTARRAENATYLRSLLASVPGILLAYHDPRITTHANHLFTFRVVPDYFGGKSHEEFLAALEAEGIPCSAGYVPLYKEGLFARVAQKSVAWCQAARDIDYPHLNLPVCEQICRDTVWLQQYQLLGTSQDMEDIATAIARIQKVWGK
jgi:dTDP-4-amino-4,6-dideoxygalactose transaminase